MQELPQFTPPRVGQVDVKDEITVAMRTPSDTTPRPREAARRLARFTEAVQCKRKSPLIASPPRQKAVTKRPPHQEQAYCHSAVVTHTDLQAGRGTTHEEDGHRAAGGTSFFRVQGSLRRHFPRELDIEPS